MRTQIKTICSYTAIVALVLTASCAAHKAEDVEYSGFLKNYEVLVPGGDDEAAMVYHKPGADLKAYDKVMLERVRVYLSPNAADGLDPEELKALADYFNNALKKELSSDYTLVDQPGTGVLHIRTALTNIVPGNPVTGTTSSLVPIGMLVAGTKGATTGSGVGVGQAAAEVEILDAETGERLMAAVDRRVGGQAPFKGKFTDAKDAIDYWATRVGDRLFN